MLSTVPDLKADIVPVGYRHVAALLAMTKQHAPDNDRETY